MFLSLKLDDKCLNVVVMRSKALCSGWSQVSWLGQEKNLTNEQSVAKRRPGQQIQFSAAHMFAPAMLPNCSWRMESTFHTVEEKAWGFSMRMEQPLWKMEEVKSGQLLRSSTNVLRGSFYLVEVPNRVGQSSPRRVVRLPHTVGVAGDVQVHTVLDVLLVAM